MMALKRRELPALDKSVIDSYVDQVLQFTLARCNPELVILFGSAVSGRFDQMSDIDLLLVFSDISESTKARRNLYSGRPLQSHSVDFVCMSRIDYDRKKDCGGIAFVAKNEGRILFQGIS
jgi:predicted nucleotidyltransferase